MCFNRKVLAGLAVGALAVLAIAPGAFSRVLPFLVLAACPLSMLLMMGAMAGGKKRGATDGVAPETTRAEFESPGDEMTRLRAEVDQLRAARPARTGDPQGVSRD